MTNSGSTSQELPRGWTSTKIGEIFTFCYGKGLSEKKRDPSGNIPVYGSNGIIGYHSSALVKKPCIIVGRKGGVGLVHLSNTACWPIDTTYYIIPPIGVNLNYAYHLLKSLNLNSLDKSTAIPGLSRNDAYAQIMLLAPSNEQNRIAMKIDELFTKLDAGIDSLKKVQMQLKQYCQSVLKYAFEGKLTEKWRKINNNVESALLIIERMKEERKKNPKNKTIPLPSITLSNLPEIPEKWAWTNLGTIIEPSSQKMLPTKIEKIPYIGLEHIEKDTGKILNVGNSEEVRSTKTRFNSGDLLYGKLRPYLNKVAVVDFNGMCSTDILVFPKSPYISNKYLKFRFLYQDFVRYTNQNMSGVQHPRVDFNTISKFIIALPPFTEQEEIVEEIERHCSVIDITQQVIEKCLKSSKALRRSTLKKAFEGKLLLQDTSDEPASMLLERIKKWLLEENKKSERGIEKGKIKQMELTEFDK